MMDHRGFECECGERHEIGWCTVCDEAIWYWSEVAMIGPVGCAPGETALAHRRCARVAVSGWRVEVSMVEIEGYGAGHYIGNRVVQLYEVAL